MRDVRMRGFAERADVEEVDRFLVLHTRPLEAEDVARITSRAEQVELVIGSAGLAVLDRDWLSGAQISALQGLIGRRFQHKWALQEALAETSPAWRPLANSTVNKAHNKDLEAKLESLYRAFGAKPRR